MNFNILLIFLFTIFAYSDDVLTRSQVNETLLLQYQTMEAQLTYGAFALVGILAIILLIMRFRSRDNA